MKKLAGILLFFVLVVAANLSAANVLIHEGAQVQITIPEKWTQAFDNDQLNIKSPDGDMGVVFTVLAPEVADKALESIDAELDKSLGEVKWNNEGEATEDKINEMPCVIWTGTAKEGKLQIECIVLDVPSGKKLAIYWFDTPESEKKHAADIDIIIKGLKPVAAPVQAAPTEAAPASATENVDDATEEGDKE